MSRTRQGELDIRGQGGVTLDELWNPTPEAYMSMCAPKVPNLFMYLGPNGGPGAGSTIHMLEWLCNYMIQCVRKIQKEHIKSMVVRSVSTLFPLTIAFNRLHATSSAQANTDFSRHVDKYFAKTVFTQPVGQA